MGVLCVDVLREVPCSVGWFDETMCSSDGHVDTARKDGHVDTARKEW